MRFENMRDIQAYLDDLGVFHMDLTLNRVRRFAELFGDPGFVVAHIAGTNGKGSTSAFLESLAREHGVRTGLFTSPHFLDLCERVIVGGGCVLEENWVEAANEVHDLVGEEELTYFEFLTCVAMSVFRRAGVQLAVMEAGLGGRYDAVRAFDADVAVLTPVGMDHAGVLGPTLEYIARDKAHVIREGGVAFSAPQDRRVQAVLEERAREVQARLEFSGGVSHEIGMRGPHQRINAGVALAAWKELAVHLGIEPDEQAVQRALRSAFVPGRFQIVGEAGVAWVLDGAHNEPALESLAHTLRSERLQPAAMVVSCMRDKDLENMAPLLRGMTLGPVYCPEMAQVERMLPGAELARLLGAGAEAAPDAKGAFERAAKAGSPVLVCGSLYLLAEFYSLYPHHLLRDADENLHRG